MFDYYFTLIPSDQKQGSRALTSQPETPSGAMIATTTARHKKTMKTIIQRNLKSSYYEMKTNLYEVARIRPNEKKFSSASNKVNAALQKLPYDRTFSMTKPLPWKETSFTKKRPSTAASPTPHQRRRASKAIPAGKRVFTALTGTEVTLAPMDGCPRRKPAVTGPRTTAFSMRW